MSSGYPDLPTASIAPRRLTSASTSRSGSTESIEREVATIPGEIALQVIPQGATSADSALVKPSTPAFEVEYAVDIATETCPAWEEMLMIRPHRWARMWGTANRDIR